MPSKPALLLIIFLTICCLPALAPAAEQAKGCFPSGRPGSIMNIDDFMNGLRVFRGFCKGCHTKDNDKGAPQLTTESKTRKAWKRVFAKRYPGCAKDGTWASLSQKDLDDLNDYLFTQAANLEDPHDEGAAEECERQ